MNIMLGSMASWPVISSWSFFMPDSCIIAESWLIIAESCCAANGGHIEARPASAARPQESDGRKERRMGIPPVGCGPKGNFPEDATHEQTVLRRSPTWTRGGE